MSGNKKPVMALAQPKRVTLALAAFIKRPQADIQIGATS